MIINLRGTHGSGKSTIVRTVMSQYDACQPVWERARKRPAGYRCTRANSKSLYAVGHYETACGGADTVLSVDQAYAYIHTAAAAGDDVLVEGILLGHEVKRCIALQAEHGYQLLVIALMTPFDVCYGAVQARRVARGDDRPLKPDNVLKDWQLHNARQPGRLRAAGVQVLQLERDAALHAVQGYLGLPLSPPALDWYPGSPEPKPQQLSLM